MLISLARRLVIQSHRHRWLVLGSALVLAALSIFVTVQRLGMNTDTDALFDQDLPFEKADKAYDAQFPQDRDLIIAVVDAASKIQAEQAAERLAAVLQGRKDLFRTVRTPEGGPFFAHNGLLYLKTSELDELSANLAKAQPLLGTIITDRSARGLFKLLALAFGAAADDGNPAAVGMAPAADQAADVIEAVRAGRPAAIDWSALLSGLSPPDQAPRAFVLVQPVLDTEALAQGGTPSAFIRQSAAELGLTPEHHYRVRLTGPVPLDDEEFATVSQGTTVSGVLAIVLVGVLLFLALGSLTVVFAAVAALALGLAYTLGWAAITVGELNLISVAFAVMFVGIAVDFSIQFLMRYRAERYAGLTLRKSLSATGAAMARPLLLAAVATALGFFSFLPTAYRGVAQLGVIAGGGMLIALAVTFTVLPALLRSLHPGPERDPIGWLWANPVNTWLLAHRRRVLQGAALLALLSCVALPRLTFDFDPLKLKDPTSESMSTVLDLMGDPWATPNTLDVLVADGPAAQALADTLSKLPEVREALTVFDLIPEDQDAKRAIIDDLALLLGPALEAPAEREPATVDETIAAAKDAKAAAERFLHGGPNTPELAPLRTAAEKLVTALDGLLADPNAGTLTVLSTALVGNLDAALTPLREALAPETVTLQNLPEDLRASWIARDGRYRVQLFPAGDTRDIRVLERFVRAVRAVAPDVTGPPVVIYETGQLVTHAFAVAAGLAVITITLLLFGVLGRPGDVIRVLTPLALAALLTLGTLAAIGLPLNFANIIGLPLLLGVGVTFPIYLVSAWRDGEERLLCAPAARAVVFSALTTAAAFGSLALSKHPGTHGLGLLLTMALMYTLIATLIVLPAQLGPPPPPDKRGRRKLRRSNRIAPAAAAQTTPDAPAA